VKTRKKTIKYGDYCIKHRKVYGCLERFEGRQTSVTDGCSGRTSTVTLVEVMEQIDQSIQDN
jgi:hypothetical protein